MGWEIMASGGKKEKPPAGNHLAVCVAIIAMGDQEQEDKKTGRLYWSPRAYFVWELTTAQIAGTHDKNHVIGADLTLTTADTGKLHKWVKARTGVAIGPGFNPLTELGQACMLNVVTNKGGHSNVDGMAAVPAVFAKSVPKPTYPLTAISLDEFKSGEKTIPDWVPWCFGNPLDVYIKASREMGGVLGVTRATLRKKTDGAQENGPTPADGESADPIPF